MKKKWIVDKNTLVSKGKDCAHLYYGEKIKGNINKTIVNGNVVYDGKKFYKNKNMDNFVFPIRKK
jgi:dihydroorotase-like cyclic amidohydrolase